MSTPSGLVPAVNGDAQIQMDGTFGNASLTLGTIGRSGCVGMWMAGSSTMIVDCGGTGTTQSRVIGMTRTSSGPCQ